MWFSPFSLYHSSVTPSPSWEPNSPSATQENLRLSWNPKTHYRGDKPPPHTVYSSRLSLPLGINIVWKILLWWAVEFYCSTGGREERQKNACPQYGPGYRQFYNWEARGNTVRCGAQGISGLWNNDFTYVSDTFKNSGNYISRSWPSWYLPGTTPQSSESQVSSLLCYCHLHWPYALECFVESLRTSPVCSFLSSFNDTVLD